MHLLSRGLPDGTCVHEVGLGNLTVVENGRAAGMEVGAPGRSFLWCLFVRQGPQKPWREREEGNPRRARP